MKIEAHVSTAGGISNAVARGQEIGCEAIQIFGSSPQAWVFKPVPGEQIELFKEGLADAGIGPVFLHAIHLINLGTPIKENVQKGIDSLVNYMGLAASIDAVGVIFHSGGHGGGGFEDVSPQTVDPIKMVLDASPTGRVWRWKTRLAWDSTSELDSTSWAAPCMPLTVRA